MQFFSIWYGSALVKLDQFTGLWDIPSGHPGSKQSSANQLHMQYDSFQQGIFLVTLGRFKGIWDIASGCPGSISCSFIQLHMQLGSIRYGNILVKLDHFTGLRDISFGHLGSKQCSAIYCVCSLGQFNTVQLWCNSTRSVQVIAFRHLDAHTAQISTAQPVWYNLVLPTVGSIFSVQSAHCLWAF
jgi:hypothetical protein